MSPHWLLHGIWSGGDRVAGILSPAKMPNRMRSPWRSCRIPISFRGQIIVPAGWILLFAIFDEYRDIYRKNRLTTLTRTFFLTLIRSLILFFFDPG